MRGYFEIGIYMPKHEVNMGVLWRSAYILGAKGIFTIGNRSPSSRSDTCKSYRHIPYRNYKDIEDLYKHRPFGCQIIGVESRGRPLKNFSHPQSAIYILGAEDCGLPDELLYYCNNIVTIESYNNVCYNVAVAGSIVMYHRFLR